MKKIIKEYEVFNYEELSKEAKEKAFKLLEEVIVDGRFSWLEDYLMEDLNEFYGIDGRLSYDFSYSQGSGLSFACDSFLTEKTVKQLEEGLNEEEKEVLMQLWKDNAVKTKTHHRSAFASGYQVEVDDDMINNIDPYADMTPEKDKKLVKAFHVVRVKIINLYLSMCGRLEKEGYNVYNVSEKDVIEECKNNDITFLKDGSIANL